MKPQTCPTCDGIELLSYCCQSNLIQENNTIFRCSTCEKFCKTIQCEDCDNGKICDEQIYDNAYNKRVGNMNS